jgi:CHASE2 domain-containing sensor protein
MAKSAVINLGAGDVESGLPRITAQIWVDGKTRPEQSIGCLPVAPHLADLYCQWQDLYQSLWECTADPNDPALDLRSPLDASYRVDEILHISRGGFDRLREVFQEEINTWLHTDGFRAIDQHLRSRLHPDDEIRFVFETDDEVLQRLPWQLWRFFQDYPKAEIALGRPQYQASPLLPRKPRKKVRILAILGGVRTIDLSTDSSFLQALKDAETHFLLSPSRQELNHHLWAEPGWDMLFFAGHSQTEGNTGRIYINEETEHNSLTVDQFAAAIEGAIQRGLKLALFNSCDGLGLAAALIRLNLPQVIVMREPVTNFIAQAFFKYFLAAFAEQHLPLYLAVRQARRQLEGFENSFPGASWLPLLCQNSAVESPQWLDWLEPDRSPIRHRTLGTVALTSVMATALLSGLRYSGSLQPFELPALDQVMRLRPAESPDQRLLIVTIDEDDLNLPEQSNRRGSLSDTALTRVLQTLSSFQPRAIGLDIYHDFPLTPSALKVVNQLQTRSQFFGICKVSDPATKYEIKPMPNLKSDYQGFSDVVMDRDNVLRRHLITMDRVPGSTCNTPYALSTHLALQYLKAEGITPRYDRHNQLHLGPATFPRLHNHTGGYHSADAGGYQVMLNYRFTQASLSPAPTISLKELLRGRIKATDVRDRIVLIGVVAPSSKDALDTPYNRKVPGVFLQGQMVSHILSAVKENRRPIAAWAWQFDLLWILAWSTVGGGLVVACRSLPQRLSLELLALGSLAIVCFYGSLHSHWVPLVPPAMALLLTSVAVALILPDQDPKIPQQSI